MGFCGTQYIDAMTVYFIMGIIPLTALIIFILSIIDRKKRKKKLLPFIIGACLSALLAVFPVGSCAYMLLNPLPAVLYEEMIDLTGLSFEDCKKIYGEYFEVIVSNELYSNEYPQGIIIEQDIPAGTRIEVGNTEVRCTVSKGVQMLAVPNDIMLDTETAKKILNAASLEFVTVSSP